MEVGCQVGVLDPGGTKGDAEELREAQSPDLARVRVDSKKEVIH